MQSIITKIQTLFTQRMQDYEKTTTDILQCVSFAVDGIKEYFLTIGLHVYIEDVTIISGIFVFTTVVEGVLTDRPQMFNVGIPAEILLTQSSAKICSFLVTAASDAAQQEIKNTIFQKPPSKNRLH